MKVNKKHLIIQSIITILFILIISFSFYYIDKDLIDVILGFTAIILLVTLVVYRSSYEKRYRKINHLKKIDYIEPINLVGRNNLSFLLLFAILELILSTFIIYFIHL